jgi:hypothetical protein
MFPVFISLAPCARDPGLGILAEKRGASQATNFSPFATGGVFGPDALYQISRKAQLFIQTE